MVSSICSLLEETLKAGDSIRSDVLPMIKAGGVGVFVPFEIIWDHEHDDGPQGTPRFFAFKDMRGVVDMVAGLS